MSYDILLKEIKNAEKITIYRHILPDGDAVGSQLGLKRWINDNFPNKDVRALGNELFDTYPYVDKADEDFIKDSLAIILDTSDSRRVDDERFRIAKRTIRIDHHPHVEDFQDELLLEVERSSVCEFLTDILSSEAYSEYKITKECGEYLYSGMLTDTLNFKVPSCTGKTLRLGAYLADVGVDISAISRRMFDISYEDFALRSKLRNYLTYSDGLAYVLLEQEQLDELGISSTMIKKCVAEFGSVKEFKIWAIIAYNKDNDYYEGSLRSKKEYTVNEIAMQFGGGGHRNASGIKGFSKQDIEVLIAKLKEEIKSVDMA